MLTAILSCILSSSIAMPFLALIKTSSAFTVLSTIIGTAIGFLSGIYISIGTVSKMLSQIMTWFPLTQVNALFKNLLMKDDLEKVFESAPAKVLSDYQKEYGITLYSNSGELLTHNQLLIYIFVCIVVLTVLYLLILKGEKISKRIFVLNRITD